MREYEVDGTRFTLKDDGFAAVGAFGEVEVKVPRQWAKTHTDPRRLFLSIAQIAVVNYGKLPQELDRKATLQRISCYLAFEAEHLTLADTKREADLLRKYASGNSFYFEGWMGETGLPQPETFARYTYTEATKKLLHEDFLALQDQVEVELGCE